MGEYTVTFLGTGTSVGVPAIGCDCPVCRSSNPRDKRLRSSIYVDAGDLSWLVDTTPDLRQQCLREGIRDCDAAIFTHEHSDHIMGFDDLRRFSHGDGVTFPVYGTPECLERVRNAFKFAFDKSNWYPVYIKPVGHEIDGPFQLGRTTVVPLDVLHGKVRTIGFQFESEGRKRFAYLPDCKVLSEETMKRIAGVECLIIDATSLHELPTHLNVNEALAIWAEARPGQTWFTHVSHGIAHDEVDATLPEGVRLAYDGLKLQLT